MLSFFHLDNTVPVKRETSSRMGTAVVLSTHAAPPRIIVSLLIMPTCQVYVKSFAGRGSWWPKSVKFIFDLWPLTLILSYRSKCNFENCIFKWMSTNDWLWQQWFVGICTVCSYLLQTGYTNRCILLQTDWKANTEPFQILGLQLIEPKIPYKWVAKVEQP